MVLPVAPLFDLVIQEDLGTLTKVQEDLGTLTEV
jgi:hypothetical protein